MVGFSVKEEKPTDALSPGKFSLGHWHNSAINHIIFQVHYSEQLSKFQNEDTELK